MPLEALADDALVRVIIGSMELAARSVPRRSAGLAAPRSRLAGRSQFTALGTTLLSRRAAGTPLTTRRHAARHGTRERLLDVAERHPDLLADRTDALAARVLSRRLAQRFGGVEYPKGGASLPGPCEAETKRPGERRQAFARDATVDPAAGGAFTTPQLLLMLSGIGPAGHPQARWHPGARGSARRRPQPAGPLAEIGVVNRMTQAW
ncbi:hypothetical protein ACTMU2_40550 [Cupriavidus basilensis]